MEQAEAASQNESSALQNTNFVIVRLVIPISERILCQLDIHVSVHHDIIYENDQQDANV
jgi:hypothetical protein